VPFTAQTRMSGVDLDGRKAEGRADAVEKFVQALGTVSPSAGCGRRRRAPGRHAAVVSDGAKGSA
jgi:high-affinity K+ transport system ATPase subunit B